MSDYSLILTLGHNASAIAVKDGHIVAGYEEERFTMKKADSNFAISAINACLDHMPMGVEPEIYVNHWFLDRKLPEDNKYWRPSILRQICNVKRIISLDDLSITHHDGHMHSAEAFVGKDFPDHQAWVIDGFGSFGENISIYDVNAGVSKLRDRFFGFGPSLGMFYQYATSYMGMEMHNHEYKILAYEVHCITEFPHLEEALLELADDYSEQWFGQLNTINRTLDPVLSLDALPAMKDWVGKVLDNVLLVCGYPSVDLRTKRLITSRFTQLYVEGCVKQLLAHYAPTNLVVSGGFFYNVKVNNLLVKSISGKFSAMPLAGDQGAGLGVYVAAGNELVWPEHLFWGQRNLSGVPTADGIIKTTSAAETRDMAIRYMDKYGFVNVVRGAMEFGPRSLCNTATLALPTLEMNGIINKINDRTNEMPMAPVMTADQTNAFFENTHKVHKSLEYMVAALDYKSGMAEKVPGAAHYYDDNIVWTGRPQIVSGHDSMMQGLLANYGPLINTSFNYHGVPIVNSVADIMYTHSKQRSVSENVYTIVQTNQGV